MKSKVQVETKLQEQQLLHIMRRLQEERISQLIDFAIFLEMQQVKADGTDGNEKWDALLERDDTQCLLEKMADEAASEIAAGKAMPMRFTDDGRLRR